MPLNVRPSDRENEKKVFAFLRENFLPFSNLTFEHIEDPTAPFDYHLYFNNEPIIYLDVKGCRMPYEKLNIFEDTKYQAMQLAPDCSFFIAYNYPDGRLKLICLDDANLEDQSGVRYEIRSDRHLEKTLKVIENAPQTWHFQDESVKYIPLN
jgi:hypothetical protein